jgi:hypothetical protein
LLLSYFYCFGCFFNIKIFGIRSALAKARLYSAKWTIKQINIQFPVIVSNFFEATFAHDMMIFANNLRLNVLSVLMKTDLACKRIESIL